MKIFSLIAGASALLSAQAATAGTIAGTVYDSAGLPAAGVEMEIAALGLAAKSDADGNFRFEQVEAGAQEIAVETGRAVMHLGVDVTEQGETRRNVFLLGRNAAADPAMQAARTDPVLIESIELAELFLREADDREPVAWHWRDSDG